MEIRELPTEVTASIPFSATGLTEAFYLLDNDGLVLVIRAPDGRVQVSVSLPRQGNYTHDAVSMAQRLLNGRGNRMPVASEAVVLAIAVMTLADRLQGAPLTPAPDGSGLVQAVPS